MSKPLLYIVFFIFSFQLLHSQDSLLLEQIYTSAKIHYRNNPDSAFYYVNKGLLNSSESIDYKGKFQLLKSFLFKRINKLDEALIENDIALQISERNKNLVLKAKTLGLRADIYREKGNMMKAIEMNAKTIEVTKKAKDTLSLIGAINSFGILYEELEELDKSIEYYLEAIDLALIIQDEEISGTYSNLVIVFNKLGNPQKAKYYLSKAFYYAKYYEDNYYLLICNARYAGIMQDESKIDSAIYYYNIAKEMGIEQKRYNGIASNCLNLANLYGKQKKYTLALRNLKQGQKYAKGTKREDDYLIMLAATNLKKGDLKETNNFINIIETKFKNKLDPQASNSLNKVKREYYEEIQDYRNAFIALKATSSFTDSMRTKSEKRIALDTEAKWQNEKKTLENNALKTEKRIQSLQLSRQKSMLLIGGISLGLISLLSFRLFGKNKKIKSQNNTLASNNQTIKLLNSEITHRVKNQFVLATDLLKRQKRKAQNDEIKAIAEESENNLRAIAAVNKRLEMSNDYNYVNIADVLTEIIDELNYNFGKINDNTISVIKEIESLKLPQDKATYLGLIVNELYTNSYKHAFKTISNPNVKLSLSNKDGKIIMNYQDNGQSDNVNTGGKGTNLINSLINQLNATMDTSYTDGMRFKLTMNYEK